MRPAGIKSSLATLTRFARVFWPHVRSQWRLIVIGLAGLLAGTLMRVLEPWPLKFVIDRITERGPDQVRVSIDAINQLTSEQLLLGAAIALVIIAALRAVMTYASTIGFALAGNRSLTRIRAALFRHLQNLSLRFHGKSRGGDMVVRMVGDVGMVQEVAVTAFLPLLGNILILGAMFAVMFWLDSALASIALVTLPVLALATIKRGKRIRQAAKRTRHREGALAATAAESMSAIKTVQSLSLGDRFMSSFASQNDASMSEGVRVKRLSAGLERGVDVLIAISTALVLWFGASRVIQGLLSPGELLVFMFYLKGAFRPLRDFAKYGARLAKASAAADRIIELFETRAEVVEADDARALPAGIQGHVHYHNISFSYEENAPVLDGIDLDIRPGTHVALVGPSGSGKSTLAALLLRLYDPGSGTISIDGHDLKSLQISSLRAHITTLLQDTILFAGSIRDNIAFGQDNVELERIVEAARLANAHEFISALPEGYDTLVGERGVNLSNGQRQRIAIARAALRDTPILILDEPTTGLDRDNERLVLEALQRLAHKRTTIHITHRPEAAAIADRILFLHQGKVVEDGTHDELTVRRGRYADLLVTDNGTPDKRYAS